MPVSHRVQVVDDLEAGIGRMAVDAAQIGEKIEGEGLLVAQAFAESDDGLAVHREARLAAKDDGGADGGAEARAKGIEVHRALPAAPAAIFSWSRMRPSSSASGFTGQPGM